MAFELDHDMLAIQQQARATAAQAAPFAAEADECSLVHQPTLDVLRASGLCSLMVPAAHGGRHERVDPLAVCVVREALMRASSHLDSLFALQGIGSYAIAVAGTDEQREEWLPRVAGAEVLAALALTEPVAGSDLRGIETTLVDHGGEVELNGAKSFISNAGAAGFYTTLAREQDRFSLVLVPADAPGVSVTASPEIIAPHVLGEVSFDRVRLPASARLGEPGAGFRHVLATLSVFRISVAGAAVGLMDGALACAARHAAARGLTAKSPLMVTPGSEQVRATIERDGLLADLESVGATVLANACGPCIGQWNRGDVADGTPNSIVTSYNRNFPKRNDGYASTNAFVASPETVVALALAGTLEFDPARDTISAPDGTEVALEVGPGTELPGQGFDPGASGFIAPPDNGNGVEVRVSAASERLQLLEPFSAWDGADFHGLPVLLKALGKCTTDHISMAGPWLRYRGHLENISGNLYLGAVNAFTGAVGEGKNQLDGATGSFPDIAAAYHAAGQRWVVVGDRNLGEGSSREHAAMEPRYRGCAAVIARSFARIHETNLKKQGVLALTFADAGDYDRIDEDDRVSILGLSDLAPGAPVPVQVAKPDGTTLDITAEHTLSHDQIEWFRAGSALNLIRRRTKG